MPAIDEGLAADDLDPVMRTSHRLKGSLGMLAAHSAETAAKKLEHHAGSGKMEQARDSRAALRAEMERLRPALTALAPRDFSRSEWGSRASTPSVQ